MNIIEYIERQKKFSLQVYGPAKRTLGIIDHIQKELEEIKEANPPDDLEEWIDVIKLAFDGAWRAGYTSSEIVHALIIKQEKFEKRSYPDWRNFTEDEAIEHIREGK